MTTLLQTLRKPLENKAIFIAHAGADKMDRQGYTMEADRIFPESKATITTPEGKKYTVNVGPAARYCGCAFHLENQICKHLVWLRVKLNDASEEEYQLELRAAEFEERELARFEIGDAKF